VRFPLCFSPGQHRHRLLSDDGSVSNCCLQQMRNTCRGSTLSHLSSTSGISRNLSAISSGRSPQHTGAFLRGHAGIPPCRSGSAGAPPGIRHSLMTFSGSRSIFSRTFKDSARAVSFEGQACVWVDASGGCTSASVTISFGGRVGSRA
jgi:hypothetical protein